LELEGRPSLAIDISSSWRWGMLTEVAGCHFITNSSVRISLILLLLSLGHEEEIISNIDLWSSVAIWWSYSSVLSSDTQRHLWSILLPKSLLRSRFGWLRSRLNGWSITSRIHSSINWLLPLESLLLLGVELIEVHRAWLNLINYMLNTSHIVLCRGCVDSSVRRRWDVLLAILAYHCLCGHLLVVEMPRAWDHPTLSPGRSKIGTCCWYVRTSSSQL
jgi:hypothetical protein